MDTQAFVLVSILALQSGLAISAQTLVNVTTPSGRLGGVRETLTMPDFQNVIVTSFWGITYAEPPVGPLRFRKPVAKQRNPGSYFLADTESAACAQNPVILKSWVPGPAAMSEDCLKLNVYVPGQPRSSPPSASKLPVMVWLYGGAFLIGQTKIYDGRRLAGLGNVIVVTVNYRLGPLGFLSTEDGVAPGNLGLWDQHVALRWVHDNVEAFGGDSGRVTIFGESAGGASSVYQALYPGNKGLFHRVIAESGTALCPWAFQPMSGRTLADRLAVRMGCRVQGQGSHRSQAIVECLRGKPFLDIVTNSSVGSIDETLFRAEWVPTADGDFITRDPIETLRWPPNRESSANLGLFRDVDLLIGTNSNDGEVIAGITVQMFLKDRTGRTFQDSGLKRHFVTDLYLPRMTQDRYGVTGDQMTQAMDSIYADHSHDTERGRVLQEILDSTSDFEFILPAITTAKCHQNLSANSGQSTYVYNFGYQFPYVARPDWLEGAAHGDDLPFVFGLPNSMAEAFNLTASRVFFQWPLSKIIMTYWSNFAKTGDPNKPETVPWLWPRYDLHPSDIMTLPPDPSVNQDEASLRMSERQRLWDDSLPRLAAGTTQQQHSSNRVVITDGQPEVLVNGSRIVGQLTNSGRTAAFLGLPYAQPPVGQLRFKKTVPLSKLPAVINATEAKPDCYSVPPGAGQSEDCLYVNVWVPVSSGDAPLAVMAWIHGGGFITGSAVGPGGDYLAGDNQVIVVSMSYRVGPLGFLSTGDETSPGNYGLWDQHTALLWVRDNVAAFGGDPHSVTVFGESAGGKSVSLQVVSPHSEGVFRRAVMQSGTAYCPTALQWKPAQTATRLGASLSCVTVTMAALVQCLRERKAEEISRVADSLWDDDPLRQLIDFGWAPVEDGDFVPKLYSPDGSPAPLSPAFSGSVMVGVNNNEGALLKLWRLYKAAALDPGVEGKLHRPQFFRDRFASTVLRQMFKSLPEDSPSFSTAAEVIQFAYTDWTSANTTVGSPDLYNAYGEQAYVSPSFQFLRQWLAARQKPSASAKGESGGDGKVFAYVFDNYPEVAAPEGLSGMKHGDDVYYTFGIVGYKLRQMNVSDNVVAKETALAKHFQALLTNFAKSGDPGRPPQVAAWPAWQEFDLRDQHYLALSSTPALSSRYKARNMTLWLSLVQDIVTTGTTNGQGHAQKCTEHTSGSTKKYIRLHEFLQLLIVFAVGRIFIV